MVRYRKFQVIEGGGEGEKFWMTETERSGNDDDEAKRSDVNNAIYTTSIEDSK